MLLAQAEKSMTGPAATPENLMLYRSVFRGRNRKIFFSHVGRFRKNCAAIWSWIGCLFSLRATGAIPSASPWYSSLAHREWCRFFVRYQLMRMGN